MKKPESIDEIASMLRGEPASSVEDVDQASARRARIVPVLEQLVVSTTAARRQRESRRRFGALVATLAAAAGLSIAIGWPGRPEEAPGRRASEARQASAAHDPTLQPSDDPRRGAARIVAAAPGASIGVEGHAQVPVRVGQDVEAGSRVMTNGTTASALTHTGVSLELDRDSTIRMLGGSREEERVLLERGRVSVAVPPGDRSRVFVIATSDAEIVVHGTRFTVEITSARGTQVDVVEGEVEVRRGVEELRLRSGGQWSSSSAPAPPSAPPPPDPRKGAPLGPSVSAGSSSDLPDQNRLYADAMAARRAGDDAAVIARLDELLRRWPDSPLAPEARVERERALERLPHP